MQKKLIALAVSSVVAGMYMAPASAATSNVDVYGKLHVSVNFLDDQLTTVNDMTVSSNASRIGFKGSEDLGGGLSAIWQVEGHVNLDERNGGFMDRNSFVGLSSKTMGTILAGNHDTPSKLVGRKVDLFGDTQADSRNLLGKGQRINSNDRVRNVIVYKSPSFSGLDIAAAYTTDGAENTTNPDAEDKTMWSASAMYSNGPLYVGVGYTDGDGLLGGTAKNVDNEWVVAASFKFGDFRLVGEYNKSNADDVGTQDYKAWMAGVSYKMGNITLKGNYMDGDYSGTTVDPQQWTIGVDYAMSKRTSVYALYADGEGVTWGKGTSSTDQHGYDATGGNVDSTIISIGMVHSF